MTPTNEEPLSPATPPIGEATADREYLQRVAFAPYYRRKLLRMRARLGDAGGGGYVPVPVLNGMTMLVNPNDFIGNRVVRQGAYSYEYIFLIREAARAIDRTGVMADVGANIGNHSLFLATVFDRVLAFEPNPRLVEIFRENMARNGIQHVQLFPMGLSNEDTQLPFEYSGDHNPSASRFLTGSDVQDLAGDLLEVRRGDAVLAAAGVDRLDAIKIDVEGHEPLALAGLAETIQRDRPFVLFEYDPRRQGTGGSFEHIMETLPGYTVLRPDFPHKRQPFGRFLALARGLSVTLTPIDEAPAERADLLAVSEHDFERLPKSGAVRVRALPPVFRGRARHNRRPFVRR